MPFTTPLALLGLLFIPAVIAMYLLKLRRDEAVVPSTLLWSRLVADVEANAPWQKLRRSLLLLLQLLLVVILALLAARPFVERPAGLARDIVLVLDTSASMAATDVVPDRLTAAKLAATEALKDLPTGGKVSVIAAGRSARIVVNESTDLSRVRQAIDDVTVTQGSGDLGDALELASKLAARSGDAQVLVATDAALATDPTGRVAARVKVLPVGRDRKNQAIVEMAVKTSPALGRSVFVSVANLDLERTSRRLELWGDGSLLEVRDVPLEAQARANVIVDDIDRSVRTLEVRLVGSDPAVVTAPDQLAVDDRAWAVIPPDRTRLILVVGEGDPYLETALSQLPNVELFGVAPNEYGPKTQRQDGRPWDLVIFEGFLPATLPRSPILAIAPPRTSDLGQVAGKLTNPGIGSLDPDEPVLRFVDLSTTHIAEASRLTTPDWARTIIPGPRGAPLLYAGTRDGLPSRGARVRAPPLRPAPPGRLPDPARQPDRRAPRVDDRAERSRGARHAGRAGHPDRSDRRQRDVARRERHGARAGHDRRLGGELRGDGPDRGLHGHADRRPRRVAGAVGQWRHGFVAQSEGEPVGRGFTGHLRRSRRDPPARGPHGPGAVRGRLVRRRRIRRSPRAPRRPSRRSAPRLPARLIPAPGPRRPSGRPRATSCGCRSSCWC